MEKGKLMMVVIIALLVLLLGTVLAVSFYILNMVNQAASAEAQGTQSESVSKELTQDDLTKVPLGAAITTNLAKGADGKSHMAKIGVVVSFNNTVEVESEAFAATLNNSLDYARSIALACIYSSTIEELSDPDGIANLANIIKEKLIDAFGTTLITDVFFNEWTLV